MSFGSAQSLKESDCSNVVVDSNHQAASTRRSLIDSFDHTSAVSRYKSLSFLERYQKEEEAKHQATVRLKKNYVKEEKNRAVIGCDLVKYGTTRKTT